MRFRLQSYHLYLLLLLMLLVITVVLTKSTLSSSPPYSRSLSSSCNNHNNNQNKVDYTFKRPIFLLNELDQWRNSNDANNNSVTYLEECKIVINIIDHNNNKNNNNNNNNNGTSFLIRVNSKKKSPTDNKCIQRGDQSLKFSIKNDKNVSILNETNLFNCDDQSNDNSNNNFFTVVENVAGQKFELSVSLGLRQGDGKDHFEHLFEEIDSITVTHVTTECSSDPKGDTFKCMTENDKQGGVCLDAKLFKCDSIESCPDGSDESNCVPINTQIQSQTTTTPTPTPVTATTTTNATTTISTTSGSTHLIILPAIVVVDDQLKREKTNHSLNFFIGLLIVLILITCVLIGIWLYGRRKRRWREMLAQLDNNNTDWEYEQLDDGPLHHSSGNSQRGGNRSQRDGRGSVPNNINRTQFSKLRHENEMKPTSSGASAAPNRSSSSSSSNSKNNMNGKNKSGVSSNERSRINNH